MTLIELHCSRCDLTKPVSEWHKSARRKNGFGTYCKECTNKITAESYERHKEKRKAAHYAWVAANPEAAKAIHDKYVANNRDKVRAAVSKSYYKHRERRLAEDKARRDNNKEQYLERERASYEKHKASRKKRLEMWLERNKSKVAAYAAKRRASKKVSSPSWLTDEDYAEIMMRYEEAAAMTKQTGVVHHVDHVVPLRGKIVCGLHVPWNLQVITGVDNLKKYNSFWPDMP